MALNTNFPTHSAAHRDYRCHASCAQIAAALTGNYRAEHLFALRQNFEAYQFLLEQIAECDGAIEALLATLAEKQPQPQAALPAARRPRQPHHHAPRFDIRTPLHRLTGGTDLSQIHSIGPHAALQLIAEIGTDMSRWKTAQHFTSWLALAPNNKVSGGRLLSSKTAPSANRAAVVLRRCAMTLSRTSTALGAFYRRPGWQGQSDYRHRPQACRASLSGVVRPPPLPRPRRHPLSSAQSRPRVKVPAQTRPAARP